MFRLLFCIGFLSIFFTSCNKFKPQQFSYVGIVDDKTVFLDNDNGKVIYVDSNRIVNSIDLNSNTNEINTTKNFEDSFYSGAIFSWDVTKGLKYTFLLSTRFYNKQMLYQLNIKAENMNGEIVYKPEMEETLKKLREKKINIIFIDKEKFELESFTPQISENISLEDMYDTAGNKISEFFDVSIQGRIPITFENYMEISDIKIEGITFQRHNRSEEVIEVPW
jgi:hypothetical protein